VTLDCRERERGREGRLYDMPTFTLSQPFVITTYSGKKVDVLRQLFEKHEAEVKAREGKGEKEGKEGKDSGEEIRYVCRFVCFGGNVSFSSSPSHHSGPYTPSFLLPSPPPSLPLSVVFIEDRLQTLLGILEHPSPYVRDRADLLLAG